MILSPGTDKSDHSTVNRADVIEAISKGRGNDFPRGELGTALRIAKTTIRR